MPSKKGSTKGLIGIPVNVQLALSTLADETVIKVDMIAGATSLDKRIWWHSFKGFISISGQTATEGPLEVGCAHSDLSVAEIKEKIDAAAAVNLDDIIARERARRPVRTWGVFAGLSTNEYLNNQSGSVKKVIKFSTGEDHEPAVYVMNHAGGALAGGAAITVFGKLWGRMY